MQGTAPHRQSLRWGDRGRLCRTRKAGGSVDFSRPYPLTRPRRLPRHLHHVVPSCQSGSRKDLQPLGRGSAAGFNTACSVQAYTLVANNALGTVQRGSDGQRQWTPLHSEIGMDRYSCCTQSPSLSHTHTHTHEHTPAELSAESLQIYSLWPE